MSRSQIKLPAVIGIGFRGEPVLRDETACRASLSAFLSAFKLDGDRVLFAVCELSTASDLLFAEICLDLTLPVRVLLPACGRELDRFDPADKARAETILARAASVEQPGESVETAEASYECGIEVVQRSEVLLVLADDPQPPSTSIDTVADILSFAQELGRPILRWSTSGALCAEPEEHLLNRLASDPEMHFLAGLSDEGVAAASDSSLAAAEAWFDKMDRNANRLAPQVLGLAHLPIILTAAAALASGAAARGADRGIWLTAGTLLGIAAALFPVVLRLAYRQSLWARTRFAAEVSRSLLTLWHTPAGFQVFTPEMVPELAGMLRSLDLLKVISHLGETTPVDQFRDRYLEDRISSQVRYFAKNAAKSARESRRYRIAGLVAVSCAVSLSAWSFIGNKLLHHSGKPSREAWLAFAVSALFQTSTVAGALRIVNDCDRRQRRYREIGDLLKRWEREFKVLKTWPPVLRTVARIERALLVELIEWRSLIQNVKMPRN